MSKFSEWWDNNMYFHYGKDGEPLDAGKVLKEVAIGKTIVFEDNKLVVTDPTHGTGTTMNSDTVLEVDPLIFEQYKMLFIAGGMLVIIAILK